MMDTPRPINRFFSVNPPEKGPTPPFRLYARTIARGEDGTGHVLFDAIDADRFDSASKPGVAGLADPAWRAQLMEIGVYAVELNGSDPLQNAAIRTNAAAWLQANRRDIPDWVELRISADPTGPAILYGHARGPGSPVSLEARRAAKPTEAALLQATNINRYVRPDSAIAAALPSGPIDHVITLDVGQGAANALADKAGTAVAYVDLGGAVLADRKTWNKAMTALCISRAPPVILTHWHYDHFDCANRFPRARSNQWIAPLQPLGPGPQSAFASALISNGKLLVWVPTSPGPRTLRAGNIELEACSHRGRNLNRTGLAVWVHGPCGQPPILLPGDAGYNDISSLKPKTPISSLVVSHHGGRASGNPPTRPGGTPVRAAFSYGPQNSYGHPLAASLLCLRKAGFAIGSTRPVRDDRRTERRARTLGHIGLSWTTRLPRPSCTCGCTGGARQW